MPTPTFFTGNSASPAEYAAAVTPNDNTDLTQLARGLYIGASGDVNVDLQDGGTVLFVGLIGGTILPVRVRRVRNTSTTASSIVALY